MRTSEREREREREREIRGREGGQLKKKKRRNLTFYETLKDWMKTCTRIRLYNPFESREYIFSISDNCFKNERNRN